jgi:hypothetical protein
MKLKPGVQGFLSGSSQGMKYLCFHKRNSKNGGILSLSLKEILKSLHKGIVFLKDIKTQAGNM